MIAPSGEDDDTATRGQTSRRGIFRPTHFFIAVGREYFAEIPPVRKRRRFRELGANSNRAIHSGIHAPSAACSGKSRARGPDHLKRFPQAEQSVSHPRSSLWFCAWCHPLGDRSRASSCDQPLSQLLHDTSSGTRRSPFSGGALPRRGRVAVGLTVDAAQSRSNPAFYYAKQMAGTPPPALSTHRR